MTNSNDTAPSNTTPAMDRDEIRAILADTIRTLDCAIDAEPPTDSDANQRWLARMRTLRALAGEYRKLEKDRDLDEMAEELDLLKADDEPPADR